MADGYTYKRFTLVLHKTDSCNFTYENFFPIAAKQQHFRVVRRKQAHFWKLSICGTVAKSVEQLTNMWHSGQICGTADKCVAQWHNLWYSGHICGTVNKSVAQWTSHVQWTNLWYSWQVCGTVAKYVVQGRSLRYIAQKYGTVAKCVANSGPLYGQRPNLCSIRAKSMGEKS